LNATPPALRGYAAGETVAAYLPPLEKLALPLRPPPTRGPPLALIALRDVALALAPPGEHSPQLREEPQRIFQLKLP